MELYYKSGYVNIGNILKQNLTFNFVWGGRGTGKTYGALLYAIEHNITFMLMRRTQTQLDLINKPEFSPFKSLNRDMGWNIGIVPLTKYNGGIYHMVENDKGKLVPEGNPIGYTCALSTVANIRGFDATDIELLIYDEFIPERHARPIKAECEAFLNAYETINRNRELKGETALQVLCLANANDLGNPLFIGLQLVTKAEQMSLKGQEISLDRKRGIALFNLCKSIISQLKSNTALYRLTSGSEYADMALANKFSGESEHGVVVKRNLIEYSPVVAVGEITIYQHKSNNMYYVSAHRSGSPDYFGVSDTELKRFQRKYLYLWYAYMEYRIEFESRLCEILLTIYNK